MTTTTRVRKQVTTIANRLYRKLGNLSAAFKRAWQIVKGRILVSKIAGVTFGNRQAALKKLEQYNTGMINVSLQREAGNTYDANAIKVNVTVGTGSQYQLGYVPKDLAAVLAPLMDKGIELIARFKRVIGGVLDNHSYGALITVEI